MTKQELLDKLNNLAEADNETDHSEAEGWLLDFISDNEILDAWMNRKDRVGWWYA